MKRLFGTTVLLVLIGVTTNLRAAECRVDGGAWIGGNPNLQVPVRVQADADKTRIMLEGANLECRFKPFPGFPPSREDYWRTSTRVGSAWTPGPKFAAQITGLRINGAFSDNPVPNGIYIATMPNNLIGYPINVTPYIMLRNNPSNPIDIRVGDALGVLRLEQTNNYDTSSASLTVTYYAANNFTISPSTCTINNNNPIEINFGDVHQRAIGTDPLSTSVVSNRRLTYSCPDGGINTPITITYKGTRSSFDSRLLLMSNADVGTALVRGGAAVAVNGSFLTRITNSVGGDDVTFSLVRRTGSLPTPGAISGSGVLVMGVP